MKKQLNALTTFSKTLQDKVKALQVQNNVSVQAKVDESTMKIEEKNDN